MSTGQMILSLGAMMPLSFVVLRQAGDSLETSDSVLESKIDIMAASEASSMLERVSALAFDQHTKDSTFTGTLAQLTPAAGLGPDLNEDSVYKFNDVDDFNGYATVDSTMLGEFNISCRVSYADPTNPDDDGISYPTWHKKITVIVHGPAPAMRDSVQYSTIVSYWYFH